MNRCQFSSICFKEFSVSRPPISSRFTSKWKMSEMKMFSVERLDEGSGWGTRELDTMNLWISVESFSNNINFTDEWCWNGKGHQFMSSSSMISIFLQLQDTYIKSFLKHGIISIPNMKFPNRIFRHFDW